MILMTVLIVMFMGIALLLAVYSSFLPFVQNYGNTIQYTTAYYGAISAIERWVLAANLRGPGFDGESWWKWNWSLQTNTGNRADYKIQEFYNYWDPDKTSLLWKVNSSTAIIPSPGDGNVAVDFWTGDNSSKNYNTLNYNIAEAIALGNVEVVWAQDYYKASKTPYSTPNTSLTINLRLNPLMQERLGVKQTSNTKYLSDSLEKLPLVNWTIKGQRSGKPFSIIPRESISANSINVDKDTLVRWGRMTNGEVALTFGKNQSVFEGNHQKGILNIISSEESDLKNMGYSDILNWTTGTNLTLDLVNLLLWPKSSAKDKWAIYPFLEYQIKSSNDKKIADRFFTIQWEGRVGKYSIKMQLKKPTLEQPALGNFTIIF